MRKMRIKKMLLLTYKKVKYWPYGTLDLNIVLFDKKQKQNGHSIFMVGNNITLLIENELIINTK